MVLSIEWEFIIFCTRHIHIIHRRAGGCKDHLSYCRYFLYSFLCSPHRTQHGMFTDVTRYPLWRVQAGNDRRHSPETRHKQRKSPLYSAHLQSIVSDGPRLCGVEVGPFGHEDAGFFLKEGEGGGGPRADRCRWDSYGVREFIVVLRSTIAFTDHLTSSRLSHDQ